MAASTVTPEQVLDRYKARWRARLLWWIPTSVAAAAYAADVALTFSLGADGGFANSIAAGKIAILLVLIVLLAGKPPTVRSIIEARKGKAKFRIEAQIAELQLKKMAHEKEVARVSVRGEHEIALEQLQKEYDELVSKTAETVPLSVGDNRQ